MPRLIVNVSCSTFLRPKVSRTITGFTLRRASRLHRRPCNREPTPDRWARRKDCADTAALIFAPGGQIRARLIPLNRPRQLVDDKSTLVLGPSNSAVIISID